MKKKSKTEITKKSNFFTATTGVIAIEFALILPILLIIFLGMTEISRYILLFRKVDRIAATTADLVAKKEGVTTADLDQVYEAAKLISSPFNVDTSGKVIISSIGNPTGSEARVLWQKSYGNNPATSLVGTIGGIATLPQGFTLPEKDTLIATEVIYTYAPLFADLVIGSSTIRRYAYFRPRLGSLDTLTQS